MKGNVTVFLALVFLSAFGQPAKVESVIVFEDKTINVTLSVPIVRATNEPNFQKLQHKLKYHDTIGKKVILRPDEIEEVKFSYNGETVRLLSRQTAIGFGTFLSSNDSILLELVADGKVKMFNFYYTQSSPGVYNSTSRVRMGVFNHTVTKSILERDNELKQPDLKEFKKDMINYFGNCPSLTQKIEDDELGKENLREIVEYYNSNCTQ